MKSLNDIAEDMSSLYDDLKSGRVELKLASELANVAGKNLKARQLDLAERVFLNGQRPVGGLLEEEPKKELTQ